MNAAGTVAVIGDRFDSSDASDTYGAVWFTSRVSRGVAWSSLQRVALDPPILGVDFGASLVMDAAGSVVIVGAPAFSAEANEVPGAASSLYRLDRNATTGTWSITTGYASPAVVMSGDTPVAVTGLGAGAMVGMSSSGNVVVAGSPNRGNMDFVPQVGGAEVWECGV